MSNEWKIAPYKKIIWLGSLGKNTFPIYFSDLFLLINCNLFKFYVIILSFFLMH